MCSHFHAPAGLVLPARPWRLRRSAARLLATCLVAPAGSIGRRQAASRQARATTGMGPGRSADYWSFETIIVICKAMQDQFRLISLHITITPLPSAGAGRRTRTGLGGFAVFKAPNPHVTTCLSAVARIHFFSLAIIYKHNICGLLACIINTVNFVFIQPG